MIKEIGLFEYLKDFERNRTALSDFYVKTKECRIFGAYENGVPAGFLLTEEKRTREILVLRAENDDASVKDALLSAFLAVLPPDTAVRFRIPNDAENEKIAARHGFRIESVLHIFRCGHADYDAVQATVERYAPLYAFTEKRGYATKSFASLTEDEIRQIRDNPDGEFASFLESGEHIRGKSGKLDENCSFATVRDGKVYAYVIVVAHGEKGCIVENTSVARHARKGGTFILPFLSMLNAVIHSNYDNISFAIYEKNDDALPLMRKHFPALLSHETIQRNYVFI